MSRHDGKVWVRKLRTGYSTHPWEVRARNHNGYDYYETFYSWREALVEADQLARTREVVLPRQQLPLSLPGLEEGEQVFVTYDIEDGSVYLIDTGDGETVVLHKHELRPLALALLAHEERENE